MPTISAFYGILIQMFFDDHAPPHFHVKYAEFKAVIDIQTLSVTRARCRDVRKGSSSIGRSYTSRSFWMIGSYVSIVSSPNL